MTIGVLSSDVVELVNVLSQLTSSQLAIAITQHPSLSSHLVDALRDLAAACLQDSSPNNDDFAHQQGGLIADIVRKLIARGDPSLIKKLLPKQSSLIDLALCANAKDILARLVDETAATECIKATTIAFERASKLEARTEEERYTRISRAARALSSVVSAMPVKKTTEEKLTKAQRKRASEESRLISQTISNLRLMYEELTLAQSFGNQVGILVLKTKVSLLDATWFLVERLLMGFVKSTSLTPEKVLDKLLTAICGTSVIQSGNTPLTDMALAIDLALVRPLIEGIKASMVKYSLRLFDDLQNRKRELTAIWGAGASVSLLGSAWSQVISSTQSSVGDEIPSDELIDTIIAVLPSLGINRAGLQERLKGPQYVGKDTEAVIQMLLQEEEDGSHFTSTNKNDDLDTLQILQERANVFDEQTLQGVTVSRGKAKQRETERLDLSSGLSEEIRAAILARAEEPDSDEEQVWNPFNDAAFEVGFEEEMEEDIIENTTKGKNAVRQSRANDDDEEEDDDDDEPKEGEADGERGAAGHGVSSVESNNVAAERASERILISAWSERGESFFSNDARKVAKRVELKAKLNDLPGRRWDDGLIESWATMFARNVSKKRGRR